MTEPTNKAATPRDSRNELVARGVTIGPNDLLNTAEAAEYISAQPSALEAWRSRGGGPKFSKVGSLVRYRRKWLDEFIDSRARTVTAPRKGKKPRPQVA